MNEQLNLRLFVVVRMTVEVVVEEGIDVFDMREAFHGIRIIVVVTIEAVLVGNINVVAAPKAKVIGSVGLILCVLHIEVKAMQRSAAVEG